MSLRHIMILPIAIEKSASISPKKRECKLSVLVLSSENQDTPDYKAFNACRWSLIVSCKLQDEWRIVICLAKRSRFFRIFFERYAAFIVKD
jgi:hypothetical protein